MIMTDMKGPVNIETTTKEPDAAVLSASSSMGRVRGSEPDASVNSAVENNHHDAADNHLDSNENHNKKKNWFAFFSYFRTKEFYLVLILG